MNFQKWMLTLILSQGFQTNLIKFNCKTKSVHLCTSMFHGVVESFNGKATFLIIRGLFHMFYFQVLNLDKIKIDLIPTLLFDLSRFITGIDNRKCRTPICDSAL